MQSKKSLRFFINLIINQYFHSKCVLQFSNNDFLHFNYTANIFVSSNKSFNASDVNYYDQCGEFFLYKSHNPRETFENFERFLRMHTYKLYPHRKYIFYLNDNESNKFNDIFESPALKFVTNLLVISEGAIDKRTRFNLYTHKYVSTTETNKPMFLDTWHAKNESFTHGNDLFPDKLKNQHGRVITVSAGTYLPQTNIGKIDNNDN